MWARILGDLRLSKKRLKERIIKRIIELLILNYKDMAKTIFKATAKNIMLSIISEHPLNNNYMLYCPVTPIPPYFGSLDKCRKAQVIFEKKLREEFDTLNDEEKVGVLSELEYYRKRNGDYSIVPQIQ